MINNIDIIAIDDQKDQLVAIQDAFFLGGVPCLPIHYQYDFIENKSGIDHVKIAGFKPRVVVSDLNLRNGSLGNVMELVTPIAELLKKLAIDGPYLLIFWSGVTEKVDDVMNVLQERFNDEITLPIHYSCINKDQYLTTGNTDALKDKVQSLINESALLNAFLDWESRITKAARQTTNSLFNITKPVEMNVDSDSDSDSEYQSQHKKELRTVLAKIGNETVGVLNALTAPELALDLGLAPVLQDKLNLISNETDINIWKNAAPEIGTDIDIPLELATKLNSFYHIEKVNIDYSKDCRGVFLEICHGVTKNASKLEKLEARLGMKLNDIVEEEFLKQIVKKDKIKLVTESTKLGFIEISAECDHAQQKNKLHRYILAALTPLNYDEYKIYDKQKKRSHGGIYRVPDVHIDGHDYMLQLSFKYQIGSIPSENIWFGNPLFRLRRPGYDRNFFLAVHNIYHDQVLLLLDSFTINTGSK